MLEDLQRRETACPEPSGFLRAHGSADDGSSLALSRASRPLFPPQQAHRDRGSRAGVRFDRHGRSRATLVSTPLLARLTREEQRPSIPFCASVSGVDTLSSFTGSEQANFGKPRNMRLEHRPRRLGPAKVEHLTKNAHHVVHRSNAVVVEPNPPWLLSQHVLSWARVDPSTEPEGRPAAAEARKRATRGERGHGTIRTSAKRDRRRPSVAAGTWCRCANPLRASLLLPSSPARASKKA